MAVTRTAFQDIGGGVAGPWVLHRTRPWDVEEEAQVNVGHCEFPGTESQGGEMFGQRSGVVKTRDAGVRRGPPQNLWTEIMQSTGEDIGQGELHITG